MNPPITRADKERFAAALAEKRRRLAKAEHSTRGYRDEDGVWRGGLLSFVRHFWHVLEPGTPFVSSWVLEAISEHLEAVTFGEITNLLINVFPGAMKSLLTDVFWPAWEHGPMEMAHIRYVAFSYSSTLTERDNLKFRDLLVSAEYRLMYPNVVLRQEGARKVSNTAHGWKLASSVGGVGTGERGDRIICLPRDAMISTDCGPLPIGDIVQLKLDVLIAGFDHHSGLLKWQTIEAYEENGIGELIEIKHQAGTVRCTVDHPIYVSGRGYVRADSVQTNETIWTVLPDTVQAVRHPYSSQTKQASNLLQPRLSCAGENSGCPNEGQETMYSLWPNGLCATSSSCQAQGAMLLQPQMSRAAQSRAKQSSLSDWSHSDHMQNMWEDILPQEWRSFSFQCGMLFSQVLHAIALGLRQAKETFSQVLYSLREKFPAPSDDHCLLFQEMCECDAFGAYERDRKWPICSRRSPVSLSSGLEQPLQGPDQRTGRSSVQAMCSHEEGEQWNASRSSHRLCEGQFGPNESDHGLQVLSWINAWEEAIPFGLDRKTILSVKRIDRAETFNIRVHSCHNYFANGVLVHNCDDGHNIKESESETVRNETVRWFRESMSSRLNNMETGAKIVIMQRVNEDDIAGNILSLGLPYEHLQIPMEFVWQADENGDPYTTSIGWVDPRWKPNPEDCEGELAWPERFPEAVIQRIKKEVGPYGFASQYQQTPEARGGGILKREWWQPGESVMSADGQKYPPFSYVVASLDGAYTEKEENDPSALTIWGVFQSESGYNRAMLIHAWEKRLQFSGPRIDILPGEHESKYKVRARPHWGLIEWVAESCNRYKVDRLLIESKATGISAAQSLRNSHGRAGWTIQLVEPKGDKVARTMAVVPSFSQEMIYAPDREWANKTIDQCAVFPYGKNDDLVDSCTQAIKHLRDAGLLRSDEDRRAEEIEAVTHKGVQKKPHYPGFRRRQA